MTNPQNQTPLASDALLFSLIVPTFNEGQSIEALVSVLTEHLNQAWAGRYEIIIVDDDSPDRTWAIALRLTETVPHLRVLRRQTEKGLSTAVIRGWQVARGEILGVIDGDLQHPPETLVSLLERMEQGADLAVASRHVSGGGVSTWSVVRRFLSRGAQMLGLLLLPSVVSRVSDPMSGYFLVRRSAIAERALNPLGYKILIEVLGRGDIKTIAEVGYVFQERQDGKSKVTWQHYLEYLHHLLRLRLDRDRLGVFVRRLNFPVKRFLKFGLVGGSGVFVDMAILYLLHGVGGLGLTRSAIAAAEVAIVNNFIWNDIWTFRDLSREQRDRRRVFKRFLKFNLICLAGLILKVLLLNLLFNLFGMNAYLANLVAIAAVTLWNFWVNLKLNWRVTQVK
ncbi:MAG: glycosyltransferase [Cyanobacteria bacterium J06638_22]